MEEVKKYYYESILNKPMWEAEVEMYLKEGAPVHLFVELETALSSELFLNACKKYGALGCKIIVSTLGRDGTFTSEESVRLIESFEKAQPYVQNEIIFDLGFTLNQALHASQRLDTWASEINSAKCSGKNLSPFEKFIYCYQIASNFSYKLESDGESKYLSRSLPFVLDPNNDRICCVGFSELLTALCNRCNIACSYEGIDRFDNSDGHAVCTVHLKDEKYGIDNVFRADPTLASFDNKFGNTLAGIWMGYKTITSHFLDEAPDTDSVREGTLSMPKPENFERVLGLTAASIKLRPIMRENGEIVDSAQNYRERIKAFLSPAIQDLFLENSPKTVSLSNTPYVLQEVKSRLNNFCSFRLYELMKKREEELVELGLNTQKNPQKVQEEFESILKKYSESIKKSLRPMVEALRTLDFSEQDVQNTIFGFINDYQINDFEQRLLESEALASQYYEFRKNVIQNSYDLNPYSLLLATRNVLLSQGKNIVEANKITASLLSKSAIIEAPFLIKYNALNSGEIFASLLKPPVVPSEDFENYLKERRANIVIRKENKDLPREEQKPYSYVAEETVRSFIENNLYSNLLEISVNELLSDSSLLDAYSIIFLEHPWLKDVIKSKPVLEKGKTKEPQTFCPMESDAKEKS